MKTQSLLGPGGRVSFASVIIDAGGTLDLYNTADKTTNYERLRADYSSSIARLFTQFGGSAGARFLQVGTSASAGATSPNNFIQFGVGGAINVRPAGGTGAGPFFDLFSTLSASSGTQTYQAVTPTLNQSGTAGATILNIDPQVTGTGSGTYLIQRWGWGGTEVARMNNSGVLYSNFLSAITNIGLAASIGAANDVTLCRDAADTPALRRGPNAQAFRVYNTYTDGSNYRRWNLSWNTTTAIMQVVGAGTGTNGNLAVGNAALATGATVGYFMIPSCAGAPTGVPADIPTGQVALHYDTTNNKLYVYNGAWRSTAALT